MKLMLVRHLWGVELPHEVALPRFKQRGYEAIESPMPPDFGPFRKLLDANGLKYIPQIFTEGETVKAHIDSFRARLKQAVDTGAILINIHSGSDAWTAAERTAFYSEVVKIEADLPVPVAHETHRIRTFFNPWTTRDVLLEFPALKLCCDFSHFVCVCERTTWDFADGSLLKLFAERAAHVHARVGYAEGPQVPDPSAPEYAREVADHFVWWKAIWSSLKQRGVAVATVTPEFGPPNYLHTLPHTGVPVADLEKVCDGMADRLKAAFNSHVV